MESYCSLSPYETTSGAVAFRTGTISRNHSLTVPAHGGSGSQASTYRTTVVKTISASVNRMKCKCNVTYANQSGYESTTDSVRNAIRS